MAGKIIEAPTYEQIATILDRLATDYTTLVSVFYDVFYNTKPQYVSFEMYDESGVLKQYSIPNRAMDREGKLSGNRSPEANVSATKGVIYQDLSNGALYVKETEDGSTGWSEVTTSTSLSTYIIKGNEDPEGRVFADKGVLYINEITASLFIKNTPTGNKGWVMVSSNPDLFLHLNLDNLSDTGKTVVETLAGGYAEDEVTAESTSTRYPSSECVYKIQRALSEQINEKENKSNKVTSLSDEDTDDQYPSAKCVYGITSGLDTAVNTASSNITILGNKIEGITQKKIKEVAEDLIILEPNYKIYKKNVTQNITLSINLFESEAQNLEFDVVLKVSEEPDTVSIYGVQWSGNPNLALAGTHLITVQTFDGGQTWLGIEKGYWADVPEVVEDEENPQEPAEE